MKDVAKEISIGLALAVLVYLILQGFDLTPFYLLEQCFFIVIYVRG